MTAKQVLPIITDNIVVSKNEVRGPKVMLDSDLAELYDVETKCLNEQVGAAEENFPLFSRNMAKPLR